MMRKYCLLTILACLFIISSSSLVQAKVYNCSVAESTGVIGLDMIVGKEPVPIVRSVFENGPADIAGFKKGDRIVAIDNIPTYNRSSQEIDVAISDIPGTKIEFSIIRNGQLYNLNATVTPLHNTNNQLQELFALH